MAKLFCLLLLFLTFDQTASAQMNTDEESYSFHRMEKDLSELQQKYKSEVKVKSIGKTEFGRPIWAIKLGVGKKNIVMVGAHHGREWLTSMLLMKMVDTYAHGYHESKNVGSHSTRVLDEVSIWFVPMLNPDGVIIQQNQINAFPYKHQAHLKRMNAGLTQFSRWKANGMGVDLNRQYPADWDKLSQVSSVPYYQFYKGHQPIEAKEVQALVRFIKEVNPSIAVAYHTAGREIYWRYKNGRYLIRDYFIARSISKLTGYQLAKPAKEATGGGFTDWFITTYHRPALTIEISYLVGETNPPVSVFPIEWEHNKYVGLRLAEKAKSKFIIHNPMKDGNFNYK